MSNARKVAIATTATMSSQRMITKIIPPVTTRDFMRDRFITVIFHTVRVGPATHMGRGTIITHRIISHPTTTRPLGR